MNLKWDGILPTSKAIEEWADNASRAAKIEWDKDIRRTYVTDVEGNTTEHFYDIDGYTYRIVYPDNFQEWFFRDNAKNITLHIGKDGSKTSYTYDERSNLLTTTQNDGATSYFEYDDKDNLIGMVDAEQGRWFKEYDGSGNIIKEIDPLKRETKYNYNAMGLPIQITDAKGGSKQLKYDDQGNLISYTDCSGKETKWEYDLRGRVVFVENALKNKVEYFYSDFTTEKREPIEKGLPLNSFGQLEKIKYSDVLDPPTDADNNKNTVVKKGEKAGKNTKSTSNSNKSTKNNNQQKGSGASVIVQMSREWIEQNLLSAVGDPTLKRSILLSYSRHLFYTPLYLESMIQHEKALLSVIGQSWPLKLPDPSLHTNHSIPNQYRHDENEVKAAVNTKKERLRIKFGNLKSLDKE